MPSLKRVVLHKTDLGGFMIQHWGKYLPVTLYPRATEGLQPLADGDLVWIGPSARDDRLYLVWRSAYEDRGYNLMGTMRVS